MFEKCQTQFFSLAEQCHTQRLYVSLCAIFLWPAAFEQWPSLSDEVEDEFLDKIFGKIWVLFFIQVKYKLNKHKKQRPGPQGAGVSNRD